MNKTRAKRKILQQLNSFDSYEDMHNFLETETVGTSKMLVSDIIGQIPGFQEKINTVMLDKVISEYGNPDAPGFTFSKQVSNERLLEMYEGQEKIEGKLTNMFGPAGEDRANKIKELENIMLERNTEHKNADIKITNLQEAVAAQRFEFDKRSKYSILNIFPGMPSQAILGLTDLARDKGLEQIENRDWNWDPKYKRFGAGPELKKTQENLDKAYKDKRNIKPTYQEKSDLYENYKQIIKAEEALDGMLNQTGVDEALNYVSMEQLTKILESQ